MTGSASALTVTVQVLAGRGGPADTAMMPLRFRDSSSWRHFVLHGQKWLVTGLFVLVVVAILGVFAWLGRLVQRTFWPEARVTGVVFAALLGLLAVATVGQLFLDPFRSAVTAGSDKVGVAMGAIAVGSAVAMLMLIGNVFDA